MEMQQTTKITSWRQASMQVLNSKRRETMAKQKHVKAGFEAGLEGLKAVEIEQNNMTKKKPFLDLKT